ncbi:MAG: arginine--tRNA ligase [Deltaproteobacteria bacterium]|nr:MAG: arginine--tRNA ligase [Deltaproteobacteria bacterium]
MCGRDIWLMKKKLRHILESTLSTCFEQRLLADVPLPDYVIEIPKNANHGHFATNLPMALSGALKRNPREIATILVEQLQGRNDIFANIDIAGPGFINFLLKPDQWHQVLREVLTRGRDYGRNDWGSNEKVLVEFVSANPTGPLHIGHGRGAALGNTLCRVLSFCGYNVSSEFYINDAGQQIRMLGESIYSRWRQREDPAYPFPESGYQGDYIAELAKAVSKQADLSAMQKDEAISACARIGEEIMLREIKDDLERFRVPFDTWFSERKLHEEGIIDKTLNEFKEGGHLFNEEGALWIKTTPFGDDKDRVLRKSDGQLTYFASDISYHLDKKKRGFSWAINLWGADHHGYIPRMKAALKANGISENWLSVMLIQLVKLWKGGKEMKMSKRAGSYVTLKELIGEVGVDAARFVFLTKHHDSPLDFDIDLVKKQDSDNPVYYVQYGHARTCSIFRKAAEEGFRLPPRPGAFLKLLTLDEEISLMRMMAEFPGLLEEISKSLEPHRLTYFLTDFAGAFHRYFNLGTKFPEHRIVSGNRDLSLARLFLVQGVQQIIATGLGLMGVNSPERM